MNNNYPVHKTEEAWRELLSKEEYRVLREQGTEQPHSGGYNTHYENGTYNCRGCNQPLYASDSKFDSGCGWPSYDQSIEGAIEYRKDDTHGMVRVEIVCSNCCGHQGHVFDDGPTASGKRYCVNSASINFEAKKED